MHTLAISDVYEAVDKLPFSDEKKSYLTKLAETSYQKGSGYSIYQIDAVFLYLRLILLLEGGKGHPLFHYSDWRKDCPLLVRLSLDKIQVFCKENSLPPLQSLVVSRKTKRPGQGCFYTKTDDSLYTKADVCKQSFEELVEFVFTQDPWGNKI